MSRKVGLIWEIPVKVTSGHRDGEDMKGIGFILGAIIFAVIVVGVALVRGDIMKSMATASQENQEVASSPVIHDPTVVPAPSEYNFSNDVEVNPNIEVIANAESEAEANAKAEADAYSSPTPTPEPVEEDPAPTPTPDPLPIPDNEIHSDSLRVAPYDATQGVTGSQYTYSDFNVGFLFRESQGYSDDHCEGLPPEELEKCRDDAFDNYDEYPNRLIIETGLMTNADGEVYWYVQASPGVGGEGLDRPTVECHRGASAWEENDFRDGIGCLGNNGDLVSVDTWHEIRVIRQQEQEGPYTWSVALADSNGTLHTVAEIHHPQGMHENKLARSVLHFDRHSCSDLLEQPPGFLPCAQENPTSTLETVTGKVRVQEYTPGATGSKYRFSSLNATYRISSTVDDQRITVGLIARPDVEQPYWYVNSRAEGVPADIHCSEGDKVWEESVYDEGQGAGCLGVMDLALNTSYTVVIIPFAGMVGDNGWSVWIDGVEVAELIGEQADHSQDEFLGSSQVFDADACLLLTESPPTEAGCKTPTPGTTEGDSPLVFNAPVQVDNTLWLNRCFRELYKASVK
jgi:hypothetical protein